MSISHAYVTGRAAHGPYVQHRAHQSPPISLTLPYALFDHFLAAPRAGPLLPCCPHAHDLHFTARPRFAVINGSCGLAPAHSEQAVRQPAELFCTLDGALTDILPFLAPRYGRARTRAAIERGAEYDALRCRLFRVVVVPSLKCVNDLRACSH